MKSYCEALMRWSDRHSYLASLGMIAAVTGFGLLTTPLLRLRPSNIDIVYLLTVLVSALRWGQRPAIFTAIVSAVVFDFCFIPPEFTFGFTDLPYGINLFGYLIVAIATSTVAARSRELMIEQMARAQAEARGHAKDAILRHISHELRAPLNALLGWAQLLERANLDRIRASRAVSGVEDSASLLARLVDDLLSASRITSGKFSVALHPTELAPIVSKAVDVAALTAEKRHVHLDSTITPVGEVLADDQRIGQIVSNLLSNALKFTPTGGRVSVRLARVGEQAELVVSDTGIGIANAFLPRVFEQFSQADTPIAEQGLGLGLSIVKHLVGAHGGNITATSPGPGGGATFTVHLPIMSADVLGKSELAHDG